jgi:hypothetical protein
MRRAFKAPLGVWIAFLVLAAFSCIQCLIKAAEQTNPKLLGEQIGLCLGQAIGQVLGCGCCGPSARVRGLAFARCGSASGRPAATYHNIGLRAF